MKLFVQTQAGSFVKVLDEIENYNLDSSMGAFTVISELKNTLRQVNETYAVSAESPGLDAPQFPEVTREDIERMKRDGYLGAGLMK